MLAFLMIIAIMVIPARCHVTYIPCPAVTSSANCSFESEELCSKDYMSEDRHGLAWTSYNGNITVPGLVKERYGRRLVKGQVSALLGSPYHRYMYIRGTSDRRAWGIWTELISPPVKVNGGCLEYIYHNSVCGGSAESEETKLKVILRSQDGRSERILRQYACVNDTRWRSDHISLFATEGNFALVFTAQHHGWTNQIVAVDHVMYSSQSCSLRDDPDFDNGDCDWEYDDTCGYQLLEPITTTLIWAIQKRVRRGGVLTITGSDTGTCPHDMASVSAQSPEVTINREGCLSLNYYCGRHDTDNNNVTALVITHSSVDDVTNSSRVLHEFPSTLGNGWLSQFVPLPNGSYFLTFTARLLLPYGDLRHDSIAIDDVEVFQESCDRIKCSQRHCDNSDRCNDHGTCTGQGRKHYTCDCAQHYLGKSCELNVPYNGDQGFAHEYDYYDYVV